ISKPLLLADARQQIAKDQTISESVRAKALELSEAFRDDPDRFHAAARELVRLPYAGGSLYQEALRCAEIAGRLAPQEADVQNTLGAAQYRAGRYQDALATLERCRPLRSWKDRNALLSDAGRLLMSLWLLPTTDLTRGNHPHDLAYQAMAHARLGHHD